jgi:hypothetical protein
MNNRVFWLLAISMCNLVGASSLAPTWARGGANGFATPRSQPASPMRLQRSPIVTGFGVSGFPLAFSGRVSRQEVRRDVVVLPFRGRSIDVRNDLGLRRRAQIQNGLPIGVWPYWSPIDMPLMEVPPVGTPAASNLPVIVVSGLANGAQQRTAPETRPDYSYVAGCRAIPNGYHCDPPANGVVAP